MTRTLTAAMASHVAGSAHTRARMLRLDMVDGSTVAVTDHDRLLAFDLGDGSADYSPRTGIVASDLALSTGFDADDVEVTGPLVEAATEAWHVTKTMVEGGRFDDAEARFFEVNWSDLSAGAAKLLKGRVVLAEVIGGRFKLAINSEIARFAQETGRTITGFCDADFGDTRCGFAVVQVAATVTAVTGARQFTISFAGTYADDYFNLGLVRFTSGELDGCRPVEVFDWASGGAGAGTVALWAELPEAPGIGDTLEISQGCGKTRAACLAFDNVVNFRGFPDVPGSDQVLRYANPGA